MRGTAPVAALAAAVAVLATGAGSSAQAPDRPEGIDVSRFNGTIDWAEVGASGVRFAFVQASRGDGDDCAVVPDRCGPDEYYVANRLGARANRIRVGAYHRAFADGKSPRGARRDARHQARVFTAVVRRLGRRDLLPVLDVEQPFGRLGEAELRAWIHAWLKLVEAELGIKPIIYTNASSWAATGDTRRFAREGYPLWVANWNVPAPVVPAGGWDGRGWSIWQYTSKGRAPGVNGNVDRNRLAVPLSRLRVRGGR